jgi:hypothetical protein
MHTLIMFVIFKEKKRESLKKLTHTQSLAQNK